MSASPFPSIEAQRAEIRRTEAAARAADRATAAPALLKLILDEPLTPDERQAVVLEVLRGWRRAPTGAS
jgi:hypothetical protein